LALALVNVLAVGAGAAPKDDPWAAYRFLVGEWVGEGGGKPGPGAGQCSFAFELREKVLVRRNRAEFLAAGVRPASVHEDLMVIYPAAGAKAARAVFFDSEGHVILYTASASEDGRALTFLSEAKPSEPRFRLTYARAEGGAVKVRFEVAPPGKPEDFKTYLEGALRRKEGQSRPR
jgi:hypothetical protein